MGTELGLGRRTFLMMTLAGLVPARFAEAQSEVTRPAVSETDCPLEIITPIASDGYRGLGVLRKPPGKGPFPVIVCLHAGMVTVPLSDLQSYARDAANLTRFLASGYIIVVPTYRSRVVDPQSPVSLEDSLAAVEYARKLPYVDAESIVVFGSSGGGDLALEVAARTKICAVVPEEPAIMMMAGMFTTATPKKGVLYEPADSFFLLTNSKQYYTPAIQKFFRAKLDKIECPILLVQGDQDRTVLPLQGLFGDILIPELRAAGKMLTVSTYAEQLHCFCFYTGLPPLVPRPASSPEAALRAFRDIDVFCRRYVKTQPKPMDASLLTYVAVSQ